MEFSQLLFNKDHLAILLLLFVGYGLHSQVVGINTENPQATLDIHGANHNGAVTATDGLLVPRVNDLMEAGIEDGQLVYLIADTGTLKKGFYNWNGDAWVPLILNKSFAASNSLVEPDVVIFGSPTSVQSFSVTQNRNITDYTAFDVNIPVAGIAGNTTSVSIEIKIIHTYDWDLDIFLESPTGQILELSTNNGSSGDNYTNTTFIDSAPNNITSGIAPFSGEYRPEGTFSPSGSPTNRTGNITTLAGFNGFNANGIWRLRIGDEYGADSGTFKSATLKITGSNPVEWVLIGEVPILYLNNSAIMVNSTYSADPLDINGVVTALTRTASSAGSAGTLTAALPSTILNYASASAKGDGNYWVNTFNQAREVGLTDNTVYYYQLWRKGNIETPVAANQTFNLIPMRLDR